MAKYLRSKVIIGLLVVAALGVAAVLTQLGDDDGSAARTAVTPTSEPLEPTGEPPQARRDAPPAGGDQRDKGRAGGNGSGAVAYVGCSLTRGAVDGYHEVGGTRLWPASGKYSGGTIGRWAQGLTDASRFWGEFQSFQEAKPAQTVWWQLCTHDETDDGRNYTFALKVLDEIRRRIPGVTVYVSAENGWEPPHVCKLTGPDGPARMRALADRLVSEKRALPGPDVGDLRLDETTADGCHPNEKGQSVIGAKLAAFPF